MLFGLAEGLPSSEVLEVGLWLVEVDPVQVASRDVDEVIDLASWCSEWQQELVALCLTVLGALDRDRAVGDQLDLQAARWGRAVQDGE